MAGFRTDEGSEETSNEEELTNQELILEIITWVLFIGIIYFTIKGSLILSLQTTSPMVGVSGDSMIHPYDNAWKNYYVERHYDVSSFPFQGGLQNGDLVILEGVDSLDDLQLGDVIVWREDSSYGRNEKIIHRVAMINKENNFVRTRSDHYNKLDDEKVRLEDIVGRAVFSIPYLGYPAR